MCGNTHYAHYISRLLHPFISNGSHIHNGCSKISREKKESMKRKANNLYSFIGCSVKLNTFYLMT